MALDENINSNDHLVELSNSDYEIVDGEPDIKGWDVKNEQGQKIGDVHDLLFDPQSRKVRYLIVDLEENALDLDEDKKVLIPIGIAELHASDYQNDNGATQADHEIVDRETEGVLGNSHVHADYDANDEEDDVVIVPATVEQLRSLPSYEKGDVTPDTEMTIRRIFGEAGIAQQATPASYTKNQFYDHDHFNENKFYERGSANDSVKLPVIEENLQVGKQEVETGGARITSRIVEKPVKENITLREEHVNIERTPVNRAVSSDNMNAFKEEDIELTEHAEVPVIKKEARVVEEVSLHKDIEEKEETIRETLRNTEVDEERIDPDKRDFV